ncbi:exodeoxyribonuclease V subunit beta [Ramlibacter sp. 2FC]|uniref:exodeoxyribonuclease V subunit beta n=1 Tax=Ramlibacter sp. 2FC TaxID=2502188 RepID=UPI001484CECE|nr:exodeoxyribonuclease V subunit beta [Ramlibacter sp. 2FC]
MSDRANAPPVQPLEPLALPLAGTQVIEASAGTGKTWTLAALYLRLVLGHGREDAGLLPPQILVMTFTEAATAELRGRIRARLAEAARHFREPDRHAGDAFLTQLREAYPPEHWPRCAWRLDLAAQWMDDAAIHTIHGWSSRMLRQHALASAGLFQQSKVEDSEGLKLAAVRDYWRQWFYPLPEAALQALDEVARTPDELLAGLKPLWQAAERQPGAGPEPGADPASLLRACSDWQREIEALETAARALWAGHREALHAQLMPAMAKDLSGTVYRKEKHGDYLAQLDAWSQGAARDARNLERFSLARLLRNTKKNCTPPADPQGVFAALEQLTEGLARKPQIAEALLAHAAQAVGLAYELRKQQLAQFDFSDLLQRLYQALQAEDGHLAQAIRAQYPVALVDEFQDTDPWQWGALARIYPPTGAQDAEGPARALVMIGDPKQAIYSFRGADLATYLQARHQAQAIHTLSGNFRSTAQLVNAVNHVFAGADQPFGAIAFEPVEARNPAVQALRLPHGGAAQPAMTVWQLASDAPMTAKAYQQAMAECFASQMVALLNGRAASPGQMAVLVRSGHEARAMREALARRGVRSVYLSDRDSVYATREAADLWHMLRAVAQPRSVGFLRAALSTRSFCRRLDELDRLIRDEAAWDTQVENFNRWHQTWQRQGFLAMLYQLLHEQEIPRRLRASAPDPERRLTNLLHLGDLLQKASLELQGEGALVRYLADQLHDPAVSGEAAQMRLETDANLVQVVTMHKSKGLQYPLVFLPFVANFQAEKAASGRDDAERLAEDMRLLYVALTRAEQALWLGVARRKDDFASGQAQPRSALSRLLGRASADDLQPRLQHWAACPDIVVAPAPEPTAQAYQPDQAPLALQPARRPTRRLDSGWWQASFSALTRELSHGAPAGLSEAPSEDEERFMDAQTDSLERALPEADPADAAEAAPYNAFPAGSAYGTLLHDLLEWQLREAWPLLQGAAAGEEAQRRWQRQLDSQAESLKLAPEARALLERWIAQIATTALPLTDTDAGLAGTPALRLGQLGLAQAWPEMGFTLLAHGLGAEAIDRLIRQHVQPGQPREPLRPRRLQGLLTGFMDLVFEHAGRYHVLDYKSNKLPAYRPEALRQAMLAHRYDVQATLYLLALHRLLKARLPGYDYERHVGGAIYLFARGIDQPGAGVHLERPPLALIEALDQAFATPLARQEEPA